ncbi:MAG: hypothetical protein AAB443_01685 [Patescibacteria group bacterium]
MFAKKPALVDVIEFIAEGIKASTNASDEDARKAAIEELIKGRTLGEIVKDVFKHSKKESHDDYPIDVAPEFNLKEYLLGLSEPLDND